MDFEEEVQTIASRIKKTKDKIGSEEATKQAFVIPFIIALGYDVYDPAEVVPEFTSDVGTKKGEKVDYAIIKDGQPIMLFECKACGVNLEAEHMSQLFRYFNATEARVGVLTNGILYRFYSDLDKTNQMDSKPFLEFNMLDFSEDLLQEVKKFGKSRFDVKQLTSAATDLKYTKEIKQYLAQQLEKPSEDFVRFIVGQIYSGRKGQNVVEMFTKITGRAFNQFINEVFNQRLKAVTGKQEEKQEKPEEKQVTPVSLKGQSKKQKADDRIQTTEDELRGFEIVKVILKGYIDTERLFFRDTVSCFNILLDDNIRQPVCRLYLNDDKKFLCLPDGQIEEKIAIQSVDDLPLYRERIVNTAAKYQKQKGPPQNKGETAPAP
ncbi:MAG: type I restriction enzyme HsdR N-terminal domain-containing protein [Magnetococcales bacterium]|nr:type I restriction enzyme HsdR N-terminal domain-containing protein [Magnetococcales bacterium]